MKIFYTFIISSLLPLLSMGQVINPSFEEWDSDGLGGWETTPLDLGEDAIITNGEGAIIEPVSIESDGATEGNKYIKLNAFHVEGSSNPDFPDGNYGSFVQQKLISSEKYPYFNFDIKFDVLPGDAGIVLVEAFGDDDQLVARSHKFLQGKQLSFNTISMSLTFTGNVSYYNITLCGSLDKVLCCGFSAKAMPGSWAAFDNIEVGAPLEYAPSAMNVYANDIADNQNGTDLRVDFDVPESEENISKYHLLVVREDFDVNELPNTEAFLYNSGRKIFPSGEHKSFVFLDNEFYYFRENEEIKSSYITDGIPYKVYVLTEGMSGYLSSITSSNSIQLGEGITTLDAPQDEMMRVLVYPNPASDKVIFNIEDKDDVFIVLQSLTGGKVKTIGSSKDKITLDVQDLPEGIYIYTIENSNNGMIQEGKITIIK